MKIDLKLNPKNHVDTIIEFLNWLDYKQCKEEETGYYKTIIKNVDNHIPEEWHVDTVNEFVIFLQEEKLV